MLKQLIDIVKQTKRLLQGIAKKIELNKKNVEILQKWTALKSLVPISKKRIRRKSMFHAVLLIVVQGFLDMLGPLWLVVPPSLHMVMLGLLGVLDLGLLGLSGHLDVVQLFSGDDSSGLGH